MMRKILFFLLLLFTLISGCSTQQQVSNTNNLLTPQVSPQGKTEKIGSTWTLEKCQTLTQKSGDADTCYTMVATEKKDSSLCKQVIDARSACYRSVAAKLQDQSVCDEMEDPKLEDYQLEIEIGNCKNFVQTTSTKSGTDEPNVATGTNCENYENQEMMAAAQCYLRSAVVTKDYTVCDSIIGDTNSQMRIQCYNSVASALKDPTVCDKLNVPNYKYTEMAKQQCKQYVAST
jgi:hypothetical protein